MVPLPLHQNVRDLPVYLGLIQSWWTSCVYPTAFLRKFGVVHVQRGIQKYWNIWYIHLFHQLLCVTICDKIFMTYNLYINVQIHIHVPFNTPLDLSRLSLAWAMSRHRPCSCELLVAMCLVLRLDWVELWFSSSKWKLTSATRTYTNYTSKKQRLEVAWKSQKFVSNFEISSFLSVHSQVSMFFFQNINWLSPLNTGWISNPSSRRSTLTSWWNPWSSQTWEFGIRFLVPKTRSFGDVWRRQFASCHVSLCNKIRSTC